MPTAEMKVPRNANVRIEPKLRKKFSYVKGWDEYFRRYARENATRNVPA
jgi:hypothetical protein